MSLFLDHIGYSAYLAKMGFCMSKESSEEVEQKKRSQMIDRKLEEDSRRIRRECKMLLLGKFRMSRKESIVGLG